MKSLIIIKNLLIFNTFLKNFLRGLLPINWKRLNKNYLLVLIYNHIIYYPTPIILTYAWSFKTLAGICLVIHMLSGIFLAMHNTPHIDLAFSSVEHINNGCFIRYVYAMRIYYLYFFLEYLKFIFNILNHNLRTICSFFSVVPPSGMGKFNLFSWFSNQINELFFFETCLFAWLFLLVLSILSFLLIK